MVPEEAFASYEILNALPLLHFDIKNLSVPSPVVVDGFNHISIVKLFDPKSKSELGPTDILSLLFDKRNEPFPPDLYGESSTILVLLGPTEACSSSNITLFLFVEVSPSKEKLEVNKLSASYDLYG